MRTLAIGDIHGHLVALDALLAAADARDEDLIVTLGDCVDRGPNSRGVLDRLIALHERGCLVPLRGNHDEMMLHSRHDRSERRLWLRFGGVQTLESYGHSADAGLYHFVPERHWRFLEHDLRNWYETETHLFVHACVRPDVPVAEQDTLVLLWERLEGPVVHQSGKVLICGHTRQSTGVPLNLGTTVCLDTGIYEPDGWLTCLHVETGHYWQADQEGVVREGNLTDLL